MKRFRVFFNEGILTTIEAETEQEARKLFLEDELKEIDITNDLDMWFDFEEVPTEYLSESFEVPTSVQESLKTGAGPLAKQKT